MSRNDPSRPVRIGILTSGKDEFCHLLSLYEAFSGDPCFTPVVIPYKITQEETGFTNDVDNLLSFLREKGMSTASQQDIRPHTPSWKRWSRSRTTPAEEIDLFFFFLPYEGLLEDSLKERLRKKTICYVPYGALVNYVVYRNPFYGRCWKIFVDHPLIKENFARIRGKRWADARCVVSGLPKLDAYKNDGLGSSNCWPRAKSPDIKRALLLDHWTLQWTDPDVGSDVTEGYCQFFKYKDLFLALPQKYPSIDFVFRPHPCLFDNLVRAGRMTAQEVEGYVKAFSAFPNAVYDNCSQDYLIAFKESDCLIASGISCLVEYLPSKKPILFLEKSDGDGLNAYGKKLITYHHRARDEAAICRFLEQVVLAGQDDLYEKRLANMREHMFMPPEGSGVFIKNHIKASINRLFSSGKRTASLK